MMVFKSLPLKNYHIEVVLCLKGSDDDDVQCTSCHFKFGFHPDLRGLDNSQSFLGKTFRLFVLVTSN